MQQTNEPKKRGRPKKIDVDYAEGTKKIAEIRHSGKRLYRFFVEYDDLGPVTEVESIKAVVSDCDYPLDKVVANIGAVRFRQMIEKGLLKNGADRLKGFSFSAQLQPYLG